MTTSSLKATPECAHDVRDELKPKGIALVERLLTSGDSPRAALHLA